MVISREPEPQFPPEREFASPEPKDVSSSSYRQWDEESWNTATHFTGGVLSLFASFPLLRRAREHSDLVWFTVLVYCLALMSVYFASTLSHGIREPKARRILRSWDQGLIYLLIVATYTPLAVIFLANIWHVLTIGMWCLAIGGFLSKVAHAHQVDKIDIWLYIILGWLPVLSVPTLWQVAPFSVLALIVGGGVVYSCGAVLLSFDHRAKFIHTGWHLMVILGSCCHYFAIITSLNGPPR